MMEISTGSITATSPTTVKLDEYYVPTDPMDDLQCESCQ